MAIVPSTLFGSRANPPDSNYPQGSARDSSDGVTKDGTPLTAAWVNDMWGFLQNLLSRAGITPSGSPDTAVASDYASALLESGIIGDAAIGNVNVNKLTAGSVNLETSNIWQESVYRGPNPTKFFWQSAYIRTEVPDLPNTLTSPQLPVTFLLSAWGPTVVSASDGLGAYNTRITFTSAPDLHLDLSSGAAIFTQAHVEWFDDGTPKQRETAAASVLLTEGTGGVSSISAILTKTVRDWQTDPPTSIRLHAWFNPQTITT